ncbi:g11086 [Coccomyxa elongata]
MTSVDDAELVRKLKEVTSGADQAALLSDLGNLHLAEGRVEEGQECFRKALAAQAHCGNVEGPSPGSNAEDDWETEWEQNLGQITPPNELEQPKRSAAGKASTVPREGAQAELPRRGASRHRGETPGRSEPEAVEVPFDGRHILELYGLTSADSATQVEAFVATLGSGPVDPVVRWINDNTALAVFTNPAGARAALEASNGSYSMRPFSEACDASKAMLASELQPPRPRPKTSAAVARRLIGMALNAPTLRDKAGEQQLREQRQNHQELRRERQKQVDASWND